MIERGLAALILGALLAGCSPQIIYMQGDTITPTPPPGLMRDTFVYGKASGPADVVVVFDNSVALQNGIDFFRQTYEGLVQTLKASDPTRLLDFRVQVASAEQGRSPKAIAQPSQDPSGQFAELFTDSPDGLAILSTDWHAREAGSPLPFQTVANVLSQQEFARRTFVPLFVVALLGSDADPGDIAPESVRAALNQTRGLYQSNLMIVARGSGSGFPACGDFSAATGFEAAAAQIGWSSAAGADLCDSTWSNWQKTLVTQIVAQKTQLVLSHIPYLPTMMILRTTSRLFRYGDDYTVDPVSNEIDFARNPGLQIGDPLEAVYYLAPATPSLPGDPNPPPIPMPSSSPRASLGK